jgi:hypothetical protein
VLLGCAGVCFSARVVGVPYVGVSQVETSMQWTYAATGDVVPVGLQSRITAFWSWRLWWVVDGKRPAPQPAGSDFAPIAHARRHDEKDKDCVVERFVVRSTSSCHGGLIRPPTHTHQHSPATPPHSQGRSPSTRPVAARHAQPNNARAPPKNTAMHTVAQPTHPPTNPHTPAQPSLATAGPGSNTF